MRSVDEVQKELFRLGSIVGADANDLLIGSPLSDPVVDIEIHGDEYHYAVIERGIETIRKTTRSASDLMYLFLQSATLSMASSYAARNNRDDSSFRQIMFRKQLELLRAIRPEWAAVRQKEIDNILIKESADS